MQIDILFPTEWQLCVDSIESIDDKIVICVSKTSHTAICPFCQTLALRVHDRYSRQPADLPVVGCIVELNLIVRRFCCDNPTCQRRTFAERMPSLIASYARRTNHLLTAQRQVAFDLGGEAGARMLLNLGMPTSADTLLRLIRTAQEPETQTPRVLSVDDWAKKKGHSYGSILVDLEKHKVVDLLPDRTAESLANWLVEHPGVEVISRDRSGEYAKGATDGAPLAIQVADRWHLLENLRTHLKNLLEGKPDCLQAAAVADKENKKAAAGDSNEKQKKSTSDVGENTKAYKQISQKNGKPPQSDSSDDKASTEKQTKTQQITLARHQRRKHRYQAVKKLYRQGVSKAEIARQLKIDSKTIRKYIELDRCPPTQNARRDQVNWIRIRNLSKSGGQTV